MLETRSTRAPAQLDRSRSGKICNRFRSLLTLTISFAGHIFPCVLEGSNSGEPGLHIQDSNLRFPHGG
jgi:hypothetical protein